MKVLRRVRSDFGIFSLSLTLCLVFAQTPTLTLASTPTAPTTSATTDAVSNTPPAVNLVPNDSVEQAGSSDSPESWYSNQWGNNAARFAYLQTGYAGTRSLQVSIDRYTSGDAKWYFAPQAVTPGAFYRYSDHYISDVITYVVVALRSSTGDVSYASLGDMAPPSSTWTTYTGGLTIPPGIETATVCHLISAVGTLTTDEFSFTETPAPPPFSRAIVSITLDDGEDTDYYTALPILQKYGVHATHYVISSKVGDTAHNYMTAEQVAALAAAGEEIGSHTVTHPHLTQQTASQVASELADSQRALQALLGRPVTSFAPPWGEYDMQVLDQLKGYYRSARTTTSGYNTPINFNPYRIVGKGVDSGTTTATIKSWVDTAAANNYWLVLFYHRLDDSGGSSVSAKDFDAQIACIESSGVQIETVSQALNELTPCKLHYVAGPGGSIIGSATQVVNYDSSGTAVTASATAGYHFVKWSDDSTANPRTDTGVKADLTISAIFAINTYMVTPSAGAHGTISPATTQTVDWGANKTFTITPATGYHISDVKKDGVSIGASSSVTLANVTADHTIAATFAANTYSVVPSAGAGGSISPATTQTVTYGASTTFAIVPAAGYHVFDVEVDGASVGAVGSYTVTDVRCNRTITASFAVNAVNPVTRATSTRLSCPASVKVRRTLKLTGTVTPSSAIGKVTIYKTRLVSRKWRSAGSVRVKVTGGKYRYSLRPTKTGKWRFTAKYSGGEVGATTYKASKSKVKNVRVK